MKVDLFYRSVGEGEVIASIQVEMVSGDTAKGLPALDRAIKRFRKDLEIILHKSVPSRIREILGELPEGKQFEEKP